MTIEIHDLSRSGTGVGRDASGKIIFVPFTAPGDIVKVQVSEEGKRYSEAKLIEILKASNVRVEPKCPVFSRCGGCEWQHIPYDLQWKTKVQGLKHGLQRVNVDPDSAPWSEFPARQIWEYRNRIQLKGFKKEIGFYARGSKTIVPIEKCWIARPELNEMVGKARSDGELRTKEYKVELEVFDSGEKFSTWNASHSAKGFRQVHDEQNIVLQNWVKINLEHHSTLLDLYGGSGNLCLPVRERFQKIHCVDYTAPEENSDEKIIFHRAPVFPWLRKHEAELSKEKSNLSAILDPPREGLGEDLIPIIEIFKRLEVREILAIGCESDSWIRLVQRFQKHGWKIAGFGALDFFPQTHHVESLAVLRKG